MLIRAYGQFWNPEQVNWGRRGRGNGGKLLGNVKIDKKPYEIDFWNAVGIYVLHDQFRPVYVGKAVGTRLGPRLRDHLTDRFAGRWDMFSWYSTSTVNKTTNNTRKPGKRQVDADVVIDTLEALGILIADPPLNRKRESIPDAVEATQVTSPHPKTIRRYLEDILKQLDASTADDETA